MSGQRQSSRLLIAEAPLQILPSLAASIGLNEAIVLQQIHFLLGTPAAAIADGYRWVSRSMEVWAQQFPWWSLRTIKQIFGNLKNRNLILTGKFNQNKWDHTLWYRIDYENLEQQSPSEICTVDSAEIAQSDRATVAHSESDKIARSSLLDKKDKEEILSPKAKRVKDKTLKELILEPHKTLIEAHHYSLPEDIRPSKPAYGRYHDLAVLMVENGITPFDVVRYVIAETKSYQAWAAEHKAKPAMSLNHVDQEIKGWLQIHRVFPKDAPIKYTYIEHDDYVAEHEAA